MEKLQKKQSAINLKMKCLKYGLVLFGSVFSVFCSVQNIVNLWTMFNVTSISDNFIVYSQWGNNTADIVWGPLSHSSLRRVIYKNAWELVKLIHCNRMFAPCSVSIWHCGSVKGKYLHDKFRKKLTNISLDYFIFHFLNAFSTVYFFHSFLYCKWQQPLQVLRSQRSRIIFGPIFWTIWWVHIFMMIARPWIGFRER